MGCFHIQHSEGGLHGCTLPSTLLSVWILTVSTTFIKARPCLIQTQAPDLSLQHVTDYWCPVVGRKMSWTTTAGWTMPSPGHTQMGGQHENIVPTVADTTVTLFQLNIVNHMAKVWNKQTNTCLQNPHTALSLCIKGNSQRQAIILLVQLVP